MKIVNMLKLKEEFDYESLCRKLQNQIDHLTAEVERQQRLRENDKCTLEKQLKEHQDSFSSTKNDLIKRFEVVGSTTIIPVSTSFFVWKFSF